MIVGLGIDACSIARIQKALERTGESFFDKICTPAEKEDCTRRDEFLAGRFAAKEAFAKALNGARGVPWHDVEVRRAPSGKPELKLRAKALEMASSFGANAWHVSISHDAGIAVAIVILEHQ